MQRGRLPNGSEPLPCVQEYNRGKGGIIVKMTPMISQQERAQREAAVQFARNSVRLEGFHLSIEAEDLFTRYIHGELSNQQLNDAVRLLAGL